MKERKTVLIVEDNDDMRAGVLKLLVSQFPDVVFLEAKSGEDAVSIISSRKPNVVLMDIGLPKMSGIEATRHIKKALPNATVIMLTIHVESVYKDASFSAGASDYVSKQDMRKELIPVLERLLG